VESGVREKELQICSEIARDGFFMPLDGIRAFNPENRPFAAAELAFFFAEPTLPRWSTEGISANVCPDERTAVLTGASWEWAVL